MFKALIWEQWTLVCSFGDLNDFILNSACTRTKAVPVLHILLKIIAPMTSRN